MAAAPRRKIGVYPARILYPVPAARTATLEVVPELVRDAARDVRAAEKAFDLAARALAENDARRASTAAAALADLCRTAMKAIESALVADGLDPIRRPPPKVTRRVRAAPPPPVKTAPAAEVRSTRKEEPMRRTSEVITIGTMSLAEMEAANQAQQEREEHKVSLEERQRIDEARERQVQEYARGAPTAREKRAMDRLRHLQTITATPISFGQADIDSFQLDGGEAVQAARDAARRAIVAALQPMYDAGVAELEAARRERAEIIRRG
jgi:hypothetical protein